MLALVAVAASVAAVPAASSHAHQRPTFTATWSATTIAEGGSATVSVTTTDSSVTDATAILVTLQVGRNESTADTSDIHVRDHLGALVSPQSFPATSHHQGGWLYIRSGGSTFSYGQAKTAVFTISALDDSDTDAEDLAVWVYVNGYLAGSETLSLTTDPAFTFGSTSYTATEGGTAATVEVNLPEAPSSSVSIPIEVKSRTGATSADHSTVPTSLTFTTSDTSKTFTVTATDDTEDDDGESVTIGFGTPVPSGYIASGTTTVHLVDNDDPNEVTFGSSSYSAAEGGAAATVTVNLSRAPVASVSIPIEVKSLNNGAALSDFSTIPADVTFTTADTSKTFTVTATDDTNDDNDDESVTIGFGTPVPSGFAATDTTTINLIDDEETVLVSNILTFRAGAQGGIDLAQAFTTGTHTAGFILTSAEISITTRAGGSIPVPPLELISGTAPHTGTATAFSGPSALESGTSKRYTFTAPASTTLAASTTYWILVQPATGVEVTNTDRTGEDTRKPGWSIANNRLWRDEDSTGEFAATPSPVRMRINGLRVGGI